MSGEGRRRRSRPTPPPFWKASPQSAPPGPRRWGHAVCRRDVASASRGRCQTRPSSLPQSRRPSTAVRTCRREVAVARRRALQAVDPRRAVSCWVSDDETRAAAAVMPRASRGAGERATSKEKGKGKGSAKACVKGNNMGLGMHWGRRRTRSCAEPPRACSAAVSLGPTRRGRRCKTESTTRG